MKLMTCATLLLTVVLVGPVRAEDYALEDVLKDGIELKDVAFRVDVERAVRGNIRTRCEYAMLDATHARVRMSTKGSMLVRTEEGGEQSEVAVFEESLVVADGETVWFESARRRGEGDIKYAMEEKSEDAPHFTFPEQLPIPVIRAFCSRFDIAFERTDVYEGRQVIHFRGTAPEPVPDADGRVHGAGHAKLMAEMELVVDLETGLPLVFTVYGERDGEEHAELYPTIRQRLSKLRFGAGLTEDDFQYEEERITEKALAENAQTPDAATD